MLSDATRPPLPEPEPEPEELVPVPPARVASALSLDSSLNVGSVADGGRDDRSTTASDSEEALPWRECYDENYRRTYFFNVVSGESRWRAPPEEYVPYERPAAAPDRAVSVDAAALAAAEARFGAAAAAERPASVAL